MGYEPLPPHIEQGIDRFASEQHISHDEAVRRLLVRALEKTDKTSDENSLQSQGDSLWGAGADDSDVLDEIVADAMAERRDRFARRLNA